MRMQVVFNLRDIQHVIDRKLNFYQIIDGDDHIIDTNSILGLFVFDLIRMIQRGKLFMGR